MPEETPEETQDTSTTEQEAAPTSDGGTPAPESTDGSQAQTQDEVNWQQRATDAQAWGTRVSQENAELRQYYDTLARAQQGDADAQRQIAAMLEWEIEGAGDDTEEEDQPLEDPRFTAYLQEQDHQKALDSLESDVEGKIEKLAKDADLSFEDKEHEAVFTNAVFAHLTPGPDGRTPDVEGAFKTVTGLMDIAVNRVTSRKRGAVLAPSGSSPSHQPDLDDPEQRRDEMLRLVQARS